MLTLELALASGKLDKKLPRDAKIMISQADRSVVFTTNRQPQDTSTGKQASLCKPQPTTHDSDIVHTREDLMNLYPDLDLENLQGEPYHKEVDPSFPLKNTMQSSVNPSMSCI